VDVVKPWETIRENINISAKESLCYCELKKNKPWFDEGCSKLLDQRKQAILQWFATFVKVCIAISVDNTNTNFGGEKRGGKKNLYCRLQEKT
jgi:hypothetical protein